MPSSCCVTYHRLATASLLAVLALAVACTPDVLLAPAPELDATPTPLPLINPDLLELPDSFRYEVTLRPAGAPGEPATVITGQYQAGALAQTARRGEDEPEQLVVAPDPADGLTRSYTHAPGETSWARWPGVGFEAVYGLASPFSALRLYPLVDEKEFGEEEALAGAPEAAVRVQTVISAAAVERLLRSGASAVAARPEQREAMDLQIAPLLAPQAITYWVSTAGRVYQAAATLLAAGADGQPEPWLEVVWRYWDYSDPAIAVAAPEEYVDVADLAPSTPQVASAAAGEASLASGTRLRVRVFANPGVPAMDAAVTVYPATRSEALAAMQSADAQFAIPAGIYDVQVRAEGVETWLRDVEVTEETVASHDVLFDFGALALTVTKNGATPTLDIVIYPTGERQIWIDWRTENPTLVRLPAGIYDIEVALPDYSATKRIEGIDVKPGETVTVTVDLDQ